MLQVNELTGFGAGGSFSVTAVRTANASGPTAGGTITYSNLSIGAPSQDRIIVLLASGEKDTMGVFSATIDFGTGSNAMTARTASVGSGLCARIFSFSAPTGTTATFTVTFGDDPAQDENYVSVYALTNATFSSGGTSTADPATTGSITIPNGGLFLALGVGADTFGDTVWTNATEDLDVDIGSTFTHSTATRTEAGTVTITCTASGTERLAWTIWAATNA